MRVTSGSTAWVNARSVLELRGPEKEQGPILKVVKANHATTGTTIELAWCDRVLMPVAPPGGVIASIQRRTCERVYLDLLRDLRRPTGVYPTAITRRTTPRRCSPPILEKRATR